jgi:glucose/arabinose dehydrogenase
MKHPQSNHNGGALVFGPDKKLYIATGDGGGGNDFNGNTDKAQTTNDGHTNNTGNGQDITNVYGKILRIDPLHPSLTTVAAGSVSTNGEYRVPLSNPFSGPTAGLDEVFLYGLRNPFRIGFDRNNPNNLYIGDVGQGQREEVDLANVSTVTSSNNNYGWPFREGTRVNTDFQDANDVTINPPGGFNPIAPIAEYTHAEGISVIGGYVYRGSLIPQLQGKYVFAEYLESGQTVGMLLYMDPAVGDIQEMLIAGAPGLPISSRILAIGEDQQGELYAMLFNGQMVKLLPEPASLSLLALTVPMMLRRRTGLRRV